MPTNRDWNGFRQTGPIAYRSGTVTPWYRCAAWRANGAGGTNYGQQAGDSKQFALPMIFPGGGHVAEIGVVLTFGPGDGFPWFFLGIYDTASPTDLFPRNLLVSSPNLGTSNPTAAVSFDPDPARLYWLYLRLSRNVAANYLAAYEDGFFPVLGLERYAGFPTSVVGIGVASDVYGTLPAIFPGPNASAQPLGSFDPGGIPRLPLMGFRYG